MMMEAYLEEKQAPLTRPVTQSLHLSNTSPDPLAFKVKTTAPKLYCVRPNVAILQSGYSVDVSVVLQGFEEEPAPNYKCKDKFLIQTLRLPQDADLTIPPADLWEHFASNPKLKAGDFKIRVHFDLSADSQPQPQGSAPPLSPIPLSNGDSESPAKEAVTPPMIHTQQQQQQPLDHHGEDAVSTPREAPQSPGRIGEGKQEQPTSWKGQVAELSSNASTAASELADSAAKNLRSATGHHGNERDEVSHNGVNQGSASAQASASTRSDLAQRLAEAEVEIAALRKKLFKFESEDESNLRRRKASELQQQQQQQQSEKSQTAKLGLATRHQAAEGVSIPIVALLCLITFILTWLFF